MVTDPTYAAIKLTAKSADYAGSSLDDELLDELSKLDQIGPGQAQDMVEELVGSAGGMVPNVPSPNDFTALAVDGSNVDVNFEFAMPKPGLIVLARRSIDNGAYAECGPVVGKGDGVYSLRLTADDLAGQVVVFRFSAPGAERSFTMVTWR